MKDIGERDKTNTPLFSLCVCLTVLANEKVNLYMFLCGVWPCALESYLLCLFFVFILNVTHYEDGKGAKQVSIVGLFRIFRFSIFLFPSFRSSISLVQTSIETLFIESVAPWLHRL